MLEPFPIVDVIKNPSSRMSRVSFLYKIDFPNGKGYIGISIDPLRRWKTHLRRAKRESSLPVHNALRKFPEAAFKVLAKGELEYIQELEIKAIALFETLVPKGYNLGLGGTVGPMLNPLTSAKVSASKMGHFVSEETRRKQSLAQLARFAKPGAISEETRRKLCGRVPPLKGKTHSEEAKDKIRAKRALQVMSGESQRQLNIRRREWIASTGFTGCFQKITKAMMDSTDE